MSNSVLPTATLDGRAALIIVVEPGFLEPQACLLVRSLRRWGGEMSNLAVHAYQPRAGDNISADTKAVLREYAVVLHDEPINTAHSAYPMANPIYAGLAAEQTLDEEIIVVCDCDTVILNTPAAFLLDDSVNIAVQPVRKRSRGSTGPNDPYDTFWQSMYAACGLKPQRFVRTMTDRVRIRGYWNAGLVVARRNAGLMAAWMRHFEILHDAALSRGGSLAALDQLALAPTVDLCAEGEVAELPYQYNYVIPQRALMQNPSMRNCPLDELVHVHYHRWFNRRNFLRSAQPPFDASSERLQWLEQYLPLMPVHEEALHGLEPAALSRDEIKSLHRKESRKFKTSRAEYYSQDHHKPT